MTPLLKAEGFLIILNNIKLFNFLKRFKIKKRDITIMSEKTNKQELSEKEIKEQKAIERENKLLRFLLPIVGAIAFLLGLLGFILTVGQGKPGITVFYIILFVFGLVGVLYGVLLIIRKKKPDFLKIKKVEKEDTILD